MSLSFPLILASKSPRRKQILFEAGFDFVVKTIEVEETYPPDLSADEVPVYLAQKKAEAFNEEITNEIVITADTIVKLKNKVIGKPKSLDEAAKMLKSLSGNMHEVVSGVCIKSTDRHELVKDVTKVYFKKLDKKEIQYYLDHYKPLDKAGSYGIQEWIGMIGVEKIEGSYFNVMGLPIHKVYDTLTRMQPKS
ncbi:MAG: Maf family nucleotide pyrophosphatase [Bacteroidota bacterium]